jgi:hypothetical protein
VRIRKPTPLVFGSSCNVGSHVAYKTIDRQSSGPALHVIVLYSISCLLYVSSLSSCSDLCFVVIVISDTGLLNVSKRPVSVIGGVLRYKLHYTPESV